MGAIGDQVGIVFNTKTFCVESARLNVTIDVIAEVVTVTPISFRNANPMYLIRFHTIGCPQHIHRRRIGGIMSIKTMFRMLLVMLVSLILMNIGGKAFAYSPKVMDQGDTPYCVGFAGVAAANGAYGNKWMAKDAVKVSRLWLDGGAQTPAMAVSLGLGVKTETYTGSWGATNALNRGRVVAFTSVELADSFGLFYGVFNDESKLKVYSLARLRQNIAAPWHEMVATGRSGSRVEIQSSWGLRWGYKGRILVPLSDWQRVVNQTASYMQPFSVVK